MKIIISIFLFVLHSLVMSPFHDELPHRVQKMVHKTVGKQVEAILIKDYVEVKTDLFRLVENDLTKGYVVLRKTKGCRVGGCDGDVCTAPDQAYFSHDGLYEQFDYYFILDNDYTVIKTGVYDYPGDYGYEISSPWWLKQFTGYQGEKIEYGKDVDVVSGATVSASSMTQDLQIAYQFAVEKIKSEGE